MNPYYEPLPADVIDAEPRRPIVERVEKCRPNVVRLETTIFDPKCEPACGGVEPYQRTYRWVYPCPFGTRATDIADDIALGLSRLACIEWLQDQNYNDGHPAPESFAHDLTQVLRWGDNDEGYNELAHRLADALGVER